MIFPHFLVERIRRIDEDETLFGARKLVPLWLRPFLRYSFICVKAEIIVDLRKNWNFGECATVINVRLLTSACKLCGELRLLDYTSRYSNRAESAAFAKYAPHSYISMLVSASNVSVWKLQRIKVFAAPANKIGNITRCREPRPKYNCWEEWNALRWNARWRLRLSMKQIMSCTSKCIYVVLLHCTFCQSIRNAENLAS